MIKKDLTPSIAKTSSTEREGGTWSYEVYCEPKNVAVSLGGHHISHWGV